MIILYYSIDMDLGFKIFFFLEKLLFCILECVGFYFFKFMNFKIFFFKIGLIKGVIFYFWVFLKNYNECGDESRKVFGYVFLFL